MPKLPRLYQAPKTSSETLSWEPPSWKGLASSGLTQVTGLTLLALCMGASTNVQAAMQVTGTYVQLYTNDDGLWYDRSSHNGIQTDLDGDGTWNDWVRAGSPWHNLTWEWDQDGTSYDAAGNSSSGSVNYTTAPRLTSPPATTRSSSTSWTTGT